MEQKKEAKKAAEQKTPLASTEDYKRLEEPYEGPVQPWTRWGPYVSERSWATVREDYSADGSAWDYFTHEMARSKAYRWGEDGIAGVCDRYQIQVLAMAFWNGKDPILKERMFGLSSSEGNHGEDVKEYYYYLDSLPSHAYMKQLYKYPQQEYPYADLVDTNRGRGGQGPEYELIDTGIFGEDRYFDVYIEYAKASPEDLCVRVEVCNRGPEEAELHVLPHLWFRNTWSWGPARKPKPGISRGPEGPNHVCLLSDDQNSEPLANLPFEYRLGPRYFYGPEGGQPLFTENETNFEKLYGSPNHGPYVKDAFHRHVVDGEDCVNPEQTGTKACLHYTLSVPAGESRALLFRFTDQQMDEPLKDVEWVIRQRRAETDEFYDKIHPPKATEDEKRVQRQALASMLWTKQIYLFDVHEWLDGDDPNLPPPSSRWHIRNQHWLHLNSMRILSMPDKWEYPWFAAWDLAFHCVALALVDPWFAKSNLWYLLFEQFQHPNGQIPAYEWEFSDLNPPVHAWGCWRVYNLDKERTGEADRAFLEKCFHKLLINFAWWVNKVDADGHNVFEGGFLGLDNITVIDRSEKLPGGATLKQSDATGWMGFFCLCMMRMALELARENKIYEGLATKFFEHYVYIGAAMKNMGSQQFQLFDPKDGFFYDVLSYPNGEYHRFRVRSLVGLIPMYAIEVLEDEPLRKDFPYFLRNVDWFIKNRPDLVGRACYSEQEKGSPRHVLAIVDQAQLSRLLQYVWDESEFLSDYGIRSLSKHHEAEENHFVFGDARVAYEPGEALVKIKGGNSNWRGPIWWPTSFLIIESLIKFSDAFGSDYSISAPASPQGITPREMAEEISNRMIRIFTRDESGRRAVFGKAEKFQSDPHFRDNILFYEYFHGDRGAGLGASHQTGWSGLVANLIDMWRR